jgi:NhaP-type Na+/H+ or K+/H+ antiporter
MNIDLHHCREYIKEIFWMFYFLPIIATLLTAILLIVLHKDWYFLIPVVLVTGYCLQNMLFFMKFGKRKKKFHEGNY